MSEQPAASSPRVDWRYEEIVLVCDLVAANGWKALDRRSDTRVSDLSELLRSMSPALAADDPRFRNADGVGRKSHDLATAHPDYPGGTMKGGKTTAAVVNEFIERPDVMHRLAQAIRAAVAEPEYVSSPLVDLDYDETYDEGRSFARRHLIRERDPRARARKIAQARRTLGHVRCDTCGFDFETTYGERGNDFIECHHRNPLSVVGPTTTALSDLALLCSNCHRMIHRFRPWLTVEQLAELIQANARKTWAPPTPGTAQRSGEGRGR